VAAAGIFRIFGDERCVQRRSCFALAGEATTLAEVRLEKGVNGLKSRILPERMSVFPVMAATGTGDGRWSALVGWTLYTLVSGERPASRWYAGGAGAMPVRSPALGLDSGWQQRVLEAVGNFGDIYRRNLGMGSPLKLERGLNSNQLQGGLMLGPFLE
jgi:general L-amino acid transport system substrate-binding protein